MKCPKCGYLGFERVERCRNCGYDFSLTAPVPDLPELSMRSNRSEGVERWADLALDDRGAREEAARQLDRAVDIAGVKTPDVTKVKRPGELPLFGSDADDLPLITKASAPRTPLSVRRQTPEVPRLRSEPRVTMFDTGPVADAPVRRAASTPTPAPRTPTPSALPTPDRSVTPSAIEPASVLVRVLAASIDLMLLLAIDIGVTYLTMKICEVTLADLALLPKWPLLTFLVVQNLSYFVAFTLGGQTLGQMAMGIKVVSAKDDGAPNVGQAIVRTLVWTVLAIPAGLGLLTALFGDERRGLHDRSAGTRVVRTIA